MSAARLPALGSRVSVRSLPGIPRVRGVYGLVTAVHLEVPTTPRYTVLTSGGLILGPVGADRLCISRRRPSRRKTTPPPPAAATTTPRVPYTDAVLQRLEMSERLSRLMADGAKAAGRSW